MRESKVQEASGIMLGAGNAIQELLRRDALLVLALLTCEDSSEKIAAKLVKYGSLLRVNVKTEKAIIDSRRKAVH